MHKQSNKPDPITNFVENVASSYLNAIKKKKGGIVLLQKVAANMECSGHSETKNANYKVLVVLQNTMHVGFPKGTMESFETFEQTAEREFAEETGVNIDEMKKRSKLVNIIKR